MNQDDAMALGPTGSGAFAGIPCAARAGVVPHGGVHTRSEAR